MKTSKILKVLTMAAFFAAMASAQPTWQLVPEKAKYPKTEAVVAGFIADASYANGTTDATAYLQGLLNQLDNCSGDAQHGGGVLYLPEGRYRINGKLNIPKGVTLRGDWKKPVKGKPIEGTILMAYSGRGAADDGTNAFIIMEPAAAIMDVAIWYPEQDPNNIVQYPNTIQFGKRNYFGNEFCNAKNVTLVNAYRGIVFYQGGGTCPTINGVYGSPLSLGVEIDRIVDIGRIEHCDFSPMYWVGSGLTGSPSVTNTAYMNYLYNNATGVVMRRNDWSYTLYLTVEGYNKGFHAVESLGEDRSTPNGHNYGFDFKNCKYGVYFESRNNVGCMFSEVKTAGCEFGLYFTQDAGGVAQFYKLDLSATKCAIYTDSRASTKITLQESIIKAGKVLLQGGTLIAVDNDFNNPKPQIEFEANSRGNITGNRSDKEWEISEKSSFQNTINHQHVSTNKIPAYREFIVQTKKPSRSQLYDVVKDYGVQRGTRNNIPAADATPGIQNALNAAAAAGGGIVYLAPGHYRINGHLTIPSNVELKGGIDVSAFPMGPGSILEVYDASDPSNPTITMNANSGLRGVVFNYPNQVLCTVMPNPIDYPFAIRGNGDNIYIVNVGMRAASRGVDLFTNRCNNFYIDFLTGYFFREGVNIKNSANGVLANMQCNTIVYNCGDESKFGSYPNSNRNPCQVDGKLPREKDPYFYNSKNLTFLTLENVDDILLYGDFNYNCVVGIHVKSNVNGLALGFALDDDRTGLLLDGSNIDLDFINLQCVALQRGDATGGNVDANGADYGKSSYIKTTANYTAESVVNLYSSDYWGWAGESGVVMNGAGAINLYSANFEHSGVESFAKVNGGNLNVVGSVINSPQGSSPTYNGSAANNISTIGSLTKGDASVAGNTNITKAMKASTSGALNSCDWTPTATYTNPDGGKSNIENIICNRSDLTHFWTSGWQNKETGQGEVIVTVDMKSIQTFNQVVLSYYGSPNDGPEYYYLEVSNNGSAWTTVKEGSGRYEYLLTIPFATQNARYVRVRKPSSSPSTENYWAIYDFLVMMNNVPPTDAAGINTVSDGTPAVGYYKVLFDSKGGTNVDAQIVRYNESATSPNAPSSGSLVFAGWYLDNDGNEAFNFAAAKITEDITLFAKWETPTPIRQDKNRDNKHGILLDKNPITADFAEIVVKTPEQTTVDIVVYDNIGGVVFEKSGVKSGKEILWNLTNTQGRKIANGSYLIIAQAKSNSGKVYRYSAKLGVKREGV